MASREIDGVAYEIEQFPTEVGLDVMARLVKLGGPALGAAVSLQQFDALAEASGSVEAMLLAFARGMDGKDLVGLCQVLAKYTRAEVAPGKVVPLAGVFGEHFKGRYGALLKWAAAAIEVNFFPLGFGPALEPILSGLAAARGGSAATPGASR
jgi:hypothetical protein